MSDSKDKTPEISNAELMAKIETLEGIIEGQQKQIDNLSNVTSMTTKPKGKPKPPAPGEFTHDKTKYRFIAPRMRVNSQTRGNIFWDTARIAKDAELLAEVIERFPASFEAKK